MWTVDPTWRLAVLVCHNQRDSGSDRPSCGGVAGAPLRAWLRDRARAEGLRSAVLVARSGCLDVCSGRGTTVALLAADGAPRRVLVVREGEREALWDLVRDASRGSARSGGEAP